MKIHHFKNARILLVEGAWKRKPRHNNLELDAVGPSTERVVAYKYNMTTARISDWPDELYAHDSALCIETKRNIQNGSIRVPMIIPPHEFKSIISAMIDVDEIATIHAFADALKDFRK